MLSRLSLPSFFSRRDWRDDLSAYLDNELTPRERERIEARLAQSEEMREYLADLQDMRSVLRGFSPAPSAAPFQLTAEILERDTRTPLSASGATRALRMSMATAAVGVAAFAAVMVFDVIDSPTVTFTTTQAGDMSTNVPTAHVVTEEVELPSQPAEQSASAAVTAVSSSSEQAGGGEAAAVEVEEQEQVLEREAVQQEVEEEEAYESEPEQAEHEYEAEGAAAQETWEAQQGQPAQSEANDPSRRALTAGRQAAEGEEDEVQSVTAADVVAQEEAEPVEDGVKTSEPPKQAATGSAALDEGEVESPVASSVDQGQSNDTPSAQARAEPEKRTVARSVRHTESGWPLEERPRSGSVKLATDPSWERPVQIVLAGFAVAATAFWLTLTIVDRRRRT